MRLRVAAYLMIPTAILGLTRTAEAFDECDSDADCARGFICEEAGDVACPPVDCADGDDCAPLPCDEELFRICLPGPCASDADCGEGLGCFEVSYGECPAWPGCAPGEECPEPSPEELECTETTESLCLPSYAAPCSDDASCGEGFTCEPVEMCSCSGDGEIPSPEPGDPDDRPADPLPEPECSCETTGEAQCVPIEVECAADADCLADWSCEAPPTATTCMVNPEGEEICEPVEESASYCMPPHWEMGWYDGEDMGGALELATGDENARVTEPDPAPIGGGGGGGCSAVPGAGASSALGLLWLLPLALRRLRRR